jgi:hypothetical protein
VHLDLRTLQPSSSNPSQPAHNNDQLLQPVILDEEESLESQKWVSLSRGFPSIKAVSSQQKVCLGTTNSSSSLVPLDMPAETVRTTLQWLIRRFLEKDERLPPFVECIGGAMRALSQIITSLIFTRCMMSFFRLDCPRCVVLSEACSGMITQNRWTDEHIASSAALPCHMS